MKEGSINKEKEFRACLEKIASVSKDGERLIRVLVRQKKQILDEGACFKDPLEFLKNVEKTDELFGVAPWPPEKAVSEEIVCTLCRIDGGSEVLSSLTESIFSAWSFRLSIDGSSTLEEAVSVTAKAIAEFSRFQAIYSKALRMMSEAARVIKKDTLGYV